LGRRIRQYAETCELDLSASVTTDDQATLAFATVDEHGRASYDFYVHDTADWGWTDDELAELSPSSQAVHTGSLAAALEPGASRIALWWEALAQQGRQLLSFDPNIRAALAGRREDAVRRVERMVASSHLVKASDEDLGWLYPDLDPVEAVRRWARLGPRLAVLTRGPDGCLGVGADLQAVEVAAPTISVVDTIGAGDAFQAGLLSGLAEAGRLSPSEIGPLTLVETRRVLERAVAVAALTCTRAGADPPTLADYQGFVASSSGQGGVRR
jgi:fructokinase